MVPACTLIQRRLIPTASPANVHAQIPDLLSLSLDDVGKTVTPASILSSTLPRGSLAALAKASPTTWCSSPLLRLYRALALGGRSIVDGKELESRVRYPHFVGHPAPFEATLR
jgi:hypothetical protein